MLKNNPSALRRRLPSSRLALWTSVLKSWEPHVAGLLEKYKIEKELQNAEMHVNKLQNTMNHKEEIMSRPKREWIDRPAEQVEKKKKKTTSKKQKEKEKKREQHKPSAEEIAAIRSAKQEAKKAKLAKTLSQPESEHFYEFEEQEDKGPTLKSLKDSESVSAFTKGAKRAVQAQANRLKMEEHKILAKKHARKEDHKGKFKSLKKYKRKRK